MGVEIRMKIFSFKIDWFYVFVKTKNPPYPSLARSVRLETEAGCLPAGRQGGICLG